VLNATQPFRLGDWVTIGEVEGKVIESNWRATSLLNAQGNIVVIPNSVAARTNIVNANQPLDTHGISVVLPVEPSIRPAVVLEALGDAAASCIDVLTMPAPLVAVRRATEDAIEYEIVCFVDALDKKIGARNELFDLAHRHLCARGVVLRPLSVPAAVHPLDGAHRLLRHVSIFQTLDDDELDGLAAQLDRLAFDAGATIHAAHDTEMRALYIIARGVAKVTVQSAGELEVRRLAPGDAFGQSGILADVESHVTVRAATRATVYRLDKDALTPVLARRPEVAKEMRRLLSEHRASDATLLAQPVVSMADSAGLVDWIRESMRRFHRTTF
jgi:hypothetical protein